MSLLQGISSSAVTTPSATAYDHPLSSAAFLARRFLSFPSSAAPSGFAGLLLPEQSHRLRRHDKGFPVFSVLDDKAGSITLTGVLFQPFEEVKRDDFLVPISPGVSLARQRYSDECEAAINEQINVEYNVSYVYHAMYAYFDRDNVALKGLAKFFKESSEEEREHAEKLIKYQNIRGGRVKLHPVLNPPSEYEHVEKGDALYAMELALSLEKLVNEKLLNVHSVADKNNDPQLADFIESEFLEEQVEAIKKISDYVTQLRMVGKGHGVWHFDQKLEHEDGVH